MLYTSTCPAVHLKPVCCRGLFQNRCAYRFGTPQKCDKVMLTSNIIYKAASRSIKSQFCTSSLRICMPTTYTLDVHIAVGWGTCPMLPNSCILMPGNVKLCEIFHVNIVKRPYTQNTWSTMKETRAPPRSRKFFRSSNDFLPVPMTHPYNLLCNWQQQRSGKL
jgi:hypothetical protein